MREKHLHTMSNVSWRSQHMKHTDRQTPILLILNVLSG